MTDTKDSLVELEKLISEHARQCAGKEVDDEFEMLYGTLHRMGVDPEKLLVELNGEPHSLFYWFKEEVKRVATNQKALAIAEQIVRKHRVNPDQPETDLNVRPRIQKPAKCI